MAWFIQVLGVILATPGFEVDLELVFLELKIHTSPIPVLA